MEPDSHAGRVDPLPHAERELRCARLVVDLRSEQRRESDLEPDVEVPGGRDGDADRNGNVIAVPPHREIRMVSGVQRDERATRRLHREPDRHDERGAVPAVAIREPELDIRVGHHREAATLIPDHRADGDRGLAGVDVAHEHAAVRGDRDVPAPGDHGIPPVEAPARVRMQTGLAEDADPRAGRDPVYARVAMDDTDGQARGHAEPRRRRECERVVRDQTIDPELDGEAGGECVLGEHQRPRHEVGRIGVRRAGERGQRAQHPRGDAAAALAAALLLLPGCFTSIDDHDSAFYNGDGRAVHCAVNLDDSTHNDLASVDSALDRARDRGEVVELYAHKPGDTVSMAKLEHVLAGAQARGLPFVTYADFATGAAHGPGIALSLDDSGVDSWLAARALFLEYGARITFFVTRYARMNATRRAGLRLLANDGNDIEAHSVAHLRAPDIVDARGLAAYLADEALPSIDLLRADGYPVVAFAYPFGARTSELDDALLQYVSVLRSVTFTVSGTVDPCPR